MKMWPLDRKRGLFIRIIKMKAKSKRNGKKRNFEMGELNWTGQWSSQTQVTTI